MARTATAAAVAGLAAAAAAWFGQGPIGGVRQPAASMAPAEQATSLQWYSQATNSLGLPPALLHAAASVEIAVVDTGADVSAPDLAAKHPATYNAVTRKADVADLNGHGTLVASIAAGAADAAAGIAGSGGDARLLVIKADDRSGTISATAEAAAVRYAVRHGAKIVNLSFAGSTTSPTERAAIRFAIAHGALVVAAAGNAYDQGNPVEYPAALLQPVGSNGRGGAGLVVAASDATGKRASFSSSGSWVSLAAPGVAIPGALSHTGRPGAFPQAPLASAGALFGYGSGTSFAAPQVAGAAALVWAANPALTAAQVAQLLKATASGHGTWTPDLGYGVIDVAAAVAAATS